MIQPEYYRVLDDVDRPGRWFLKSPFQPVGPSNINPTMFNRGVRVDVRSPLAVSLRRDGTTLGFTFADFDVPIVTQAVGTALSELCGDEVQCIPVSVETVLGDYYVLNATSQIACVDERRSRTEKWTDADGRPDKVGTYKRIYGLTIDPELARGHKIFRVRGWLVALIVSAEVRELLGMMNISGIRFDSVSP